MKTAMNTLNHFKKKLIIP